jgi:hypothetical protein
MFLGPHSHGDGVEWCYVCDLEGNMIELQTSVA